MLETNVAKYMLVTCRHFLWIFISYEHIFLCLGIIMKNQETNITTTLTECHIA